MLFSESLKSHLDERLSALIDHIANGEFKTGLQLNKAQASTAPPLSMPTSAQTLTILLTAAETGVNLIEESRALGFVPFKQKYSLNHTFLSDLYDLACFCYSSGRITETASILRLFRGLVAHDSIAVPIERQLFALFGSLTCMILLKDFDAAVELLQSTQAALEGIMVGRDRKRAGQGFSTLMHLGVVTLVAWVYDKGTHPDSPGNTSASESGRLPPCTLPQGIWSLLSLLISDSWISLVSRTAPHLRPIVGIAFLIHSSNGTINKFSTEALLKELNTDASDPVLRVISSIYRPREVQACLLEIKECGRYLDRDAILGMFTKNFDLSARKILIGILKKIQVRVEDKELEEIERA